MKNLKYLLVTLVLFIAASHQKASALDQPYLLNLRSEITNQLTVASNTLPLDKKLIAKLKASLKIADKPTTNTFAANTKKVATLIPSLNKASISNIFDAEIQLILDLYLADYIAAHSNQVAILATAYPGSKQIAAQNALNKLQASIDGMNTNLLSNPAVKHLTGASKNLVRATKAVANAKKAKAPAAYVNATLTPNGAAKQTLSSKPPFAAFQLANPGTGAFIINANQLKGRTLHNLSCNFTVPSAGTHTVNASGVYTAIGQLPYNSTSGQATVTWNPANKNVFGTMTFNVSNGTRTGTLSSTFNLYYP